MLINTKGEVVNVPEHVRSSTKQGAAVLAQLREVLENPAKRCGTMFSLGTRARMRHAS
jgi:hypothetical protein